MNKTTLNNQHKLLNAKMVDFANWEMPISYPTGIIKETLFVRNQAGVFDVSHMGRLEVKGKNAKNFIETLFPINVDELQTNVWGYQSELDTHTVETHIYRLRKKILKVFKDENFIISKKNGYQIN